MTQQTIKTQGPVNIFIIRSKYRSRCNIMAIFAVNRLFEYQSRALSTSRAECSNRIYITFFRGYDQRNYQRIEQVSIEKDIKIRIRFLLAGIYTLPQSLYKDCPITFAKNKSSSSSISIEFFMGMTKPISLSLKLRERLTSCTLLI